jgi:hypothetical protein
MEAERSLDDPQLLLADSSVLFRLFSLGDGSVRAIVAHFGERLHVVHDVHEEILRHRNDPVLRGGIHAFLESFANPVRQLPAEVLGDVAHRLRFTKKWLGDEDRGETATCYYADWAWDEGEEFAVLVGDHWGWQLADEFELPYFKSPDVVVYLVCNGVITTTDAEGLWPSLVAGPVSNLHERLERTCPEQER